MAFASKITDLKFFPIRRAILAGKTIMVETSRAPAAGIMRAIATPVTILKRIDMVRTGSPSTKAVSSSKVKMYIGRMKRKVKTSTTAAITKREITCSLLIVTMEPNRYWSRLIELELLPLLITIKETANPVDMRIAVPISMKFL